MIRLVVSDATILKMINIVKQYIGAYNLSYSREMRRQAPREITTESIHLRNSV